LQALNLRAEGLIEFMVAKVFLVDDPIHWA
jgi:hypothetical protein